MGKFLTLFPSLDVALLCDMVVFLGVAVCDAMTRPAISNLLNKIALPDYLAQG